MSTTAAIALGGNVGDVPQVFMRALARLDQLTEVQLVGRSRNFETRAMGDQAGGTYTNAVALLQTTFTPSQLLCQIQQVEEEFGRERTVPWGPRTLDIDLLSFGHDVITLNSSGGPDAVGDVNTCHHRPLESYRGSLLIPHPGSWYRRFVLDPWCDVSPQFRHPVLGETVREMQKKLRESPLKVSVVGGGEQTLEQLQTAIKAAKLNEKTELADDASDTPATLTFDFRPIDKQTPHLPRSISLTDSPVGFRMAVTILNAVLDEPVPIV